MRTPEMINIEETERTQMFYLMNTTLSGSSRIDDIKGHLEGELPGLANSSIEREIASVDVSVLKLGPGLIAHRHRPAAFSQRSSSRGASIRSVQAANAGVAPRQRSVPAFLKSGASVRRVARFLKSSA
jgi:hypothetical protein